MANPDCNVYRLGFKTARNTLEMLDVWYILCLLPFGTHSYNSIDKSIKHVIVVFGEGSAELLWDFGCWVCVNLGRERVFV